MYELTSDEPEWNPHSGDLAKEEHQLTDSAGRMLEGTRKEPTKILPINVVTPETFTVSVIDTALDDAAFLLMANKPTVQVGMMSTEKGKTMILPEDLSSRWGISLEAAKNTLNKTTKKGNQDCG